MGYAFSHKFELNVGSLHALQQEISESGTFMGMFPVDIQSTLSEHSLEVGLTWRF